MKDLSRDGYSHEQIRNMLHATSGSREIRFRYDLLNQKEEKIGEIDTMTGGEVTMASMDTIKRTARFSMRDYRYRTADYMTWEIFGPMEWSDLV